MGGDGDDAFGGDDDFQSFGSSAPAPPPAAPAPAPPPPGSQQRRLAPSFVRVRIRRGDVLATEAAAFLRRSMPLPNDDNGNASGTIMPPVVAATLNELLANPSFRLDAMSVRPTTHAWAFASSPSSSAFLMHSACRLPSCRRATSRPPRQRRQQR